LLMLADKGIAVIITYV